MKGVFGQQQAYTLGMIGVVATPPALATIVAASAPVSALAPELVPILTQGGLIGASGGALSGGISATVQGKPPGQIVQYMVVGGVVGLVNPFGWIGQQGFFGAPALAGGLNAALTNWSNQALIVGPGAVDWTATSISFGGGALFGAWFGNTSPADLSIPFQGAIIQQTAKGAASGLTSGAAGVGVHF
jgi:hypothetical protein